MSDSSSAAARASERLVREFSSAGLSSSSLLADLEGVDWSAHGAVTAARIRIMGRLELAARAIRAFVDRQSQSPEQTVRYVLDALPAESAAVVHLLLGATEVRLGAGDRAWRRRLLAGVDREGWSDGLPIAWRLMVEPGHPTPEDLERLLPADPVRRLVATVLHARRADGTKVQPSDALRAYAAEGAPVDKATLGRLAARWKAADLPRLPLGLLEEMPAPAAGAFYGAPAARTKLFETATDDHTATRLTSPSLTERLQALDVLSGLRSPELASASVPREVLDALDPVTLPAGMVRPCLRATLERWRLFLAAPSIARQPTAGTPQSDELAALWGAVHGVLSHPLEQRPAIVCALPASLRAAVLRSLSLEGFRRLFETAPTDELRVRLLQAASEAGEERLGRFVRRDPSWLMRLPAAAVPQFAKGAGMDALLRAIDRHGDAIDFEAVSQRHARAVGGLLTESHGQAADASFARLAGSSHAIGWVVRHGGTKVRSAVARWMATLDDPATPREWEALAGVLVPLFPSLHTLLPGGVSIAAFGNLCAVVAEVRPEWAGQLLAVRWSAGPEPVWHAFIVVAAAHATRARKEIVPPVLDAAIRASAQKLGEAARVAPSLFAAEALERLPLPTLLRHAFVSLTLGLWLDERLSLDARRAQLPWVRETYEKTPTRAAAYELALLCSLADAHLLYRLARRAAARRAVTPERPGCAFDELYHTHELPKRSGGTRTITAPAPALKRVQRRVLDRLLATVPLHAAATGFRPEHSTVVNATRHVGRRLVVNVDIEACFPSTSYTQILRACRVAAGGLASPRAVRLLAELCSYGGALPTGAPTSPALLNVVLRRTDASVATAAARFGISYSRYADDLTFSGDGDVHRILPFVRRVLTEVGYTLADHKINLFRKGRRQVVTGLVVNEKPNLPRRIRRRLRAAVHARASGRMAEWHGKPISDATLLGHLANLRAVQPDEGSRLMAQVRAAAAPPPAAGANGGHGGEAPTGTVQDSGRGASADA